MSGRTCEICGANTPYTDWSRCERHPRLTMPYPVTTSELTGALMDAEPLARLLERLTHEGVTCAADHPAQAVEPLLTLSVRLRQLSTLLGLAADDVRDAGLRASRQSGGGHG